MFGIVFVCWVIFLIFIGLLWRLSEAEDSMAYTEVLNNDVEAENLEFQQGNVGTCIVAYPTDVAINV